MSTSNKSGGCGTCKRKHPCTKNPGSPGPRPLTYTVGPLSWITGYGPDEPIADKPFVDINPLGKQIKELVDFLKLMCLGSLNDLELFSVEQEITRVLSSKLYDLQQNGTLTPPAAGECQYVTLSDIKIDVTTKNCNFPSGKPMPPHTEAKAEFNISISTRPCS